MRVLAFTDVHGNLNVLHKLRRQSRDVDVVLVTGDLTLMGRDLKALLERLNMFKAPVLFVHGNHEEAGEVEALCERLDNVTFLHGRFVEHGGWWFGGYATHGLASEYPDQEEWVEEHDEELRAKKPLVWLDHPPPLDTSVDELTEDWHVGSASLRSLIEEYAPRYVFCGHIHETFGREDRIGETIIINSGPSGKVIELEE